MRKYTLREIVDAHAAARLDAYARRLAHLVDAKGRALEVALLSPKT